MRIRPASLPPFSFLCFLALAGCERGCLSTWLRGHSVGAPAPSAAIPIMGVDCPDGLARCTSGVVEASRAARVPRPCPLGTPPEKCSCPWDAVEDCPRGCAADGVEILAPRDRAGAQLCAPDPANPVARPAPAAVAPPGACGQGEEAVEGYRCIASLVVLCSPGDVVDAPPTARVVAACARGCFRDGDALGEERADPEAASRILCAR